MKLKNIGCSMASKVALAVALVASLLGFAGTASAHPRVVVRVAIGVPVVVPGCVSPAPVYFAPRYGYVYYHRPRLRYWDARFGCWRYR